MHLRRAAGQIQGLNASRFEHLNNELNGVIAHHLLASRARVDVAVHTGLIALVAQVHLQRVQLAAMNGGKIRDRKSTRLNSSHVAISYAVFCLKKKNRLIVGDKRASASKKYMNLSTNHPDMY